MTIRVGVDATGWTNPRGFGRFTRNVTVELARRPGLVVELVADETTPADRFPPGIVVNRVARTRPTGDDAGPGSRRSMAALIRAGSAARRSPVDVLVFPSPHTWFPVRGVPAVLGVHDAIARTHPELTFDSRSNRLAWSAKERLAMRSAARLFTVSLAARSAVADAFGVPEASLAVVPEAPDPVFRAAAPDVDGSLARLGVSSGEYVLCAAGGISPHKSVPTAIGAHARLRRSRDGVPALVIVGALEDDPYVSAASEVRRAIAEHDAHGSVILTGFVSDGELAALYRGAVAVVNTSLAEGFGLPVVEAAACGAAVVLTDIPAHRETLGGAAEFFPPGDEKALATILDGLLLEVGHRTDVAGRCRAAVGSLTWEASAIALEQVVREAAGG